MMVQLECKYKDLELQVKRFNKKNYTLQEKGLLELRNSNGKFIPLESYQEKLCNIVANLSKFVKEKGIISGEYLLQDLQYDLNIKTRVHHLL